MTAKWSNFTNSPDLLTYLFSVDWASRKIQVLSDISVGKIGRGLVGARTGDSKTRNGVSAGNSLGESAFVSIEFEEY